MPTLMRIDGLRVVIWPNNHRPAHVHVKGNGGEAVFFRHCPDGPQVMRESFGFGARVLNRIEVALQRELASLCVGWSRIHGDY